MNKKIKNILIITFIVLINIVFIDFVGAETYNNYESAVVACGDGMLDKIPQAVPKVISIAYTIIQIAIPVLLVVMGTLDLFKGITAGKEDEMKKGQGMFIKRLVSAAIIFFVFVIVKLVVSFVADGNSVQLIDCVECFINNDCETSQI